ncbi:TMEM165/GDT1 family protein [Desulfotruncus alcoholivorax]|uniref:TMEM165/GDT1 family protein n=1 Tax=Desulfotruncus alcoholivorax TaxID=265477 RepID=UPI001EE4F052|nr:TMEM165/GDT1 family protein [Desulfotruncus alcoholivorax]
MRLFLSALVVVFLSEMGDKTQITTMLLAGAKPAYVLWVGLGSAMALICTSFIEVIIGSQLIARFTKPSTIQLLSGITFLLLGLLLVFGVMGNIKLDV